MSEFGGSILSNPGTDAVRSVSVLKANGEQEVVPLSDLVEKESGSSEGAAEGTSR